jgi:hypothetical protein
MSRSSSVDGAIVGGRLLATRSFADRDVQRAPARTAEILVTKIDCRPRADRGRGVDQGPSSAPAAASLTAVALRARGRRPRASSARGRGPPDSPGVTPRPPPSPGWRSSRSRRARRRRPPGQPQDVLDLRTGIPESRERHLQDAVWHRGARTRRRESCLYYPGRWQ